MKCDGKYSGYAKIVIPKFGTYVGTVKNLDFECGTFQWEDGGRYTGMWKKTSKGGYCFQGSGTYTDAQGNEMAGKWNDGEFLEEQKKAYGGM